jgi:hypothetical protein
MRTTRLDVGTKLEEEETLSRRYITVMPCRLLTSQLASAWNASLTRCPYPLHRNSSFSTGYDSLPGPPEGALLLERHSGFNEATTSEVTPNSLAVKN